MSNKSVFKRIAAVLVLISLACMQLANANPIPYPSTPNTELVTLTIQTPESHSTLYANNSMVMNFTVIQPDSWLYYYNGFFPYVGRCYVYVYLDGSFKQAFPSTQVKVNDYTVEFDNLSSNQHTAKIDVYCLTFSQIGTYQSNVTQTATFTINANSQTISFYENPVMTIRGPFPSEAPIASTNPPPSLSPTSTPTPAVPEFSTWTILLFLTVMIVLAGLTVYLKKYKQGKLVRHA